MARLRPRALHVNVWSSAPLKELQKKFGLRQMAGVAAAKEEIAKRRHEIYCRAGWQPAADF